MPSRKNPKRRQRTGSELLGRELRRRRGARTLKDIVALSHEPALAAHVQPLSESGLSEIESGKTMPSLATIQSLAMLYRVSVSELLGCVTEERILGDSSDVPRALLELQFKELLAACRWHEALALALRGEATAADDGERIAWRSNRAACLGQLALHGESLQLLTSCSESPELSEEQRIALLHNLAAGHLNAGNLRAARRVAREALELAEAHGAARSTIAALRRLQANLLVDSSRTGGSCPEPDARAALRLLEQARRDWDPSDAVGLVDLSLLEADAWSALGNDLVAGRDAALLVERATALDSPFMVSRGLLFLATLAERKGRMRDAASHLERALDAAQRAQDPELELEARFRLFRHLRDARPGTATAHLRACEALLPLITCETYWVRACDSHARLRS